VKATVVEIVWRALRQAVARVAYVLVHLCLWPSGQALSSAHDRPKFQVQQGSLPVLLSRM
jgi:hypothetical protein